MTIIIFLVVPEGRESSVKRKNLWHGTSPQGIAKSEVTFNLNRYKCSCQNLKVNIRNQKMKRSELKIYQKNKNVTIFYWI